MWANKNEKNNFQVDFVDSQKKSIAVIGTVFVDYKGFAGADYHAQGRNLGQIQTVAGGVARNVAVNMACLGMDTWFASVVNQDSDLALRQQLVEQSIHLDFLHTVPSGGTGIWLAILAHDGTLLGSISQMPDIAILAQSIIPVLPKLFSGVKSIALETDLGVELVQEVIEQAIKADCKIYALPGNLSVLLAHPELLSRIECFICNHTEAEKLSGGLCFNHPDQALSNLRKFAHICQLKNIVVTLGEQGAVYLDAAGNSGHQPVLPVAVVDTTGAGDAFFSGTVAALVQGQALKEAVALGAKLATGVIGSCQSDCAGLSVEY